jgi:hypothetical protein
MSRVTSYDALGSMMFGPIGLALAGPLVAAIGLQATFIAGAVVATLAVVVSLMFRSVRQLTFARLRRAGGIPLMWASKYPSLVRHVTLSRVG